MKRLYALLFVLLLLLCCCSCTKKEIEIDYKKSWFDDYEILDNKVVIYCTIRVINHSNKEKTISVSGDFYDEQQSGLLTERELKAYDVNNNNSSFQVERKSIATFKIKFIGSFAGNPIKLNRLLPTLSLFDISEQLTSSIIDDFHLGRSFHSGFN